MKHHVTDLAIFGGAAAFPEKLHVGRPNIGSRERILERLGHLLDNRILTNGGPYAQEFERRIAELTGVKHCIVMCNATVALQITIKALGFAGEVIVPSFTFIATAHALQWQEITPVFCDINPQTHNLDPGRVEELLTPRTTGLIGVHLWGRPCEVEALAEIAARHRLKLLFDAAHAFACSHRGRMVGSFGHAEVFSFHATKFLNTFEGGAVVTNDDELAARIRLMHNFGFANYDKVVYLGTNGKMSEISAAMGLTSLESLDDFIVANRENYHRYQQELAGIPGIKLALYDENEKGNYQYIVLEIDEEEAGLTRDQLVDLLWAENILARRYFYPGCHRMEPYRTLDPQAGRRLPYTERLADRVLVLPTGTAMTVGEIDKVCQVMRLVMRHGRQIGERLRHGPAKVMTPKLGG